MTEKILIINQKFSKMNFEFGGSIGIKRNTRLLKNIFGAENVDEYIIPVDYRNIFESLFYFFQGYIYGIKPSQKKEINELIKKNHYTCIFLNSSYFGIIAKWFSNENIKIITFFHNVELVFFDKIVQDSKGLKRIWYCIRRRLVFKIESFAVFFSSKIIAINNRDSNDIFNIYQRKSDFILPITFSDDYDSKCAIKYSTVINKPPVLLFVGPDMPFNTIGLFWFIENCLDNIHAKLVVVGKGMKRYHNRYENKNVEFIGYVDKLSDYYYQCNAVVLPILQGSGMKTKTCEALMYGKTIFGTKEAFQGYDFLDVESLKWLCNDSKTFIKNINSYLEKNENNKINKKSRDVFLKYYQDNVYYNTINKFISEGDCL